MEFYQLKVDHIERLTDDSVRLDLFPVKYGQYNFDFKAGQYVTFEIELNGEKIRRSYSLCSSPFSGQLSVGIKKVSGGLFSTFANEALKVGDILMVSEPQGNFINRDYNSGHHFVYFAAGSGITPILSMLKETLQSNSESRATLFFGNQNVRSIMFLEELEALKNEYITRLQLYHVLSRQAQDSELFNGRIDGSKLDQWNHCFSISDTHSYYLCGPEQMILDLKETLISKGVDRDKIHFELFNTNAGDDARKKRAEKENAQEFKTVEIILDGKTMQLSFTSKDDNVLDKALEMGADLPFACKGGVCCTCKAKLEKGDVEMYVNYGLEQDEIKRGFVLTCQAYPKTDYTLINFDEV